MANQLRFRIPAAFLLLLLANTVANAQDAAAPQTPQDEPALAAPGEHPPGTDPVIPAPLVVIRTMDEVNAAEFHGSPLPEGLSPLTLKVLQWTRIGLQQVKGQAKQVAGKVTGDAKLAARDGEQSAGKV